VPACPCQEIKAESALIKVNQLLQQVRQVPKIADWRIQASTQMLWMM